MPRKASAPSSRSARRNGRTDRRRQSRRRQFSTRHSGMVRRTRPQMCNCTSGTLEIPGSRFARPGMTAPNHRARNVVTDHLQMNHDSYPDDYIRQILTGVKSIALVGASPVDVRPSYFAFKYLVQHGYDMIPVNPGHVGKSLLGPPFLPSLRDIARPIDMIDIFRSSIHI